VNPYHTLPTIVDGDVTLWESRNILTYLVDKYATDDTLYPKDVVARARVNQSLFLDSEMYNDFGSFYYPTLYEMPGDKARHTKAIASLEIFEKDLAGRAYAAGDHLTVADISLAVTVSVIDSFGFDLKPYPNIVAWFGKCKEEIGGYKEINQHGLDQLQTLNRYKAAKA
jgi:glutathione S-transferase